MNSVRAIQQLNKRELEAGISPEGSWHTDYRDTAFVYIGGLAFELSEGDIIAIASQYGEPVWVKLARDKETGKSRGFAWIKYEDQRSCDLAVDNLGGATILDRVIRVDHARYKPHDDEDMRDNTYGDVDMGGDDDDNRRGSESDSDDDRPMLPEELELERLTEKLDLDDPMRDSMIKQQQEKVDAAVAKLKRRARREKERKSRHRRHRRDSSKDRHRDRDSKRIKDAEHHRHDRRSRHRDDKSDDDRRHRSSKHRSVSEDRDKHRRRDQSRDRRDRSRDRHRDQSPDRRDRSEDRRRDQSPDRRDRSRDRRRRRHSSSSEDRRSRSSRSPSPYRER